MFDPDRYARAVRFAATRHGTQRVPGTELPYLSHLTWVTAELLAALPSTPNVDSELAVLCALLHDSIEDTDATHADVAAEFGTAVADGVQALSKDKSVADPMGDSLRRIREQPGAVWMVKLADRIANLAPAPAHWTAAKRAKYRAEAVTIADALAGVSAHLDRRIRERIANYEV